MIGNDFDFGVKPIDEFTFDDCFVRIVQDRFDGVESDPELLERYSELLSSLQQRDDAMFRNATDKVALERYVSSHPLDNTAKNYLLRHVPEANKKITEMNEVSKSKRKRIIIGVLIFLCLILILGITGYRKNNVVCAFSGLDFDMNGGEGEITIMSTTHIDLSASHSCFSIDSIYKSGSTTHVFIKCKENPGYPKNGTLRVTYYSTIWGIDIFQKVIEIPMTQATGRGSYLNVSTYIELEHTSNRKDLYINCDGIWTVQEIDNPGNWLGVYKKGKCDTLHLSSSTNNTSDRKIAKLELKTGDIVKIINISQKPHPPMVVWGSTTQTIDNTDVYPVRYSVTFNTNYLNPTGDLKLVLIIKNDKTGEEFIKEETSLSPNSNNQYSAEIGIRTNRLPDGSYSAYWKLYSNGSYIEDIFGHTEDCTYKGFRHGPKI